MSHFAQTPTYGAEIEKVFSSTNGEPQAVGQEYFEAIHETSVERGESPVFNCIGDVVLGVTNGIGCETLDNSFVLGESSVWPVVSEEDGGLNRLSEVVNQQLTDAVEALEPAGGTILNMSNHPLIMIDDETYARFVAPKPVYSFMRNVRGWDHKSGINAKAQNSPSVGVTAESAVDALNCSLGFGAAAIALFGNSPFDQGALSGHKESRLSLWPDMFQHNHSAGDRRTIEMPERPFHHFKDYIKWMFGDDTSMYFVVIDKGAFSKDEKGDVAFLKIDGNPSVLEFLLGDVWHGLEYDSEHRHHITPSMSHFEAMQFTQFAGARIRYKFKDSNPSIEEFNESMAGSDDEVDRFFDTHSEYIYIEEREPGANFPDQELQDLGDDIAGSVVISPAALYAGVIRNLKESKALINRYGWDNLRALREAAIVHGMDAEYNGVNVRELCHDVLEVASHGLAAGEQWMLTYPNHVLDSGQSGADRALKRYDQLTGTPRERIAQIARERAIVLK